MGIRKLSLSPERLQIFKSNISNRTDVSLHPEVIKADYIKPPFGHWKIFEGPVEVKYFPKDEPVHLIEFNQRHKDLTSFVRDENFDDLKKEIRAALEPAQVRHLVISFYDCYNGDKLRASSGGEIKLPNGNKRYSPDRTSQLEIFLRDLLKDSLPKSGKKLSLIHVENNIYWNTGLKDIPNLVHDNLADATFNNTAAYTQEEAPVQTYNKLRLFADEKNHHDEPLPDESLPNEVYLP